MANIPLDLRSSYNFQILQEIKQLNKQSFQVLMKISPSKNLEARKVGACALCLN
jgi:hypothetical protein